MTPKQLTLPVRLGSGMGRRSTLALCWARAMTSWAAVAPAAPQQAEQATGYCVPENGGSITSRVTAAKQVAYLALKQMVAPARW